MESGAVRPLGWSQNGDTVDAWIPFLPGGRCVCGGLPYDTASHVVMTPSRTARDTAARNRAVRAEDSAGAFISLAPDTRALHEETPPPGIGGTAPCSGRILDGGPGILPCLPVLARVVKGEPHDP